METVFIPTHLKAGFLMRQYARENLLKHFQTHSLKGFGIESLLRGIIAAGAIIHYLKDTEHPHLQHISGIQRLDRENYLWMDQFTVRNLELLPGGDNHFSLLQTIGPYRFPDGSPNDETLDAHAIERYYSHL